MTLSMASLPTVSHDIINGITTNSYPLHYQWHHYQQLAMTLSIAFLTTVSHDIINGITTNS